MRTYNFAIISTQLCDITRNYFMKSENWCLDLCARRDSNPEPSDP